MISRIALILILFPALINAAFAQTTAFTYQGKLTDGAEPASGNYDVQFKLFDTATVGTGTQQGSTITQSNVPVSAGVFIVQLDFGAYPVDMDIARRPNHAPEVNNRTSPSD